ncbi:major facilitator superfamily MFS_1 [Streptomyces viridosporus ATCC 14672]|uniref:Major facilitator superfamily MFS_1 n=1 Tax=Streptomyces viridosporus (strain ATCC 14672 / DSM 40746 / JCM 4963 / KCTC 9882 / NRRL B-12104 / FH 1290) TaxID=566461 RepID=D6A401_STRV1|nr:major facilitator superfamily MFS_1 [Streptomyces viridosporus ATCC 14672]
MSYPEPSWEILPRKTGQSVSPDAWPRPGEDHER